MVATELADVHWMLDVVHEVSSFSIVAGGWGIDALVGRQTRPHRDLDLLVPSPSVELLVRAIQAHSFVVTTNWLPARIELSDSGADRHLDIHPAVDDGRNGWWQSGVDGERFETKAAAVTTGVIGQRPVQCLTATRQLELHQTYSPGAKDLADMALLRQFLDP